LHFRNNIVMEYTINEIKLIARHCETKDELALAKKQFTFLFNHSKLRPGRFKKAKGLLILREMFIDKKI
jgi:hypothetical protein